MDCNFTFVNICNGRYARCPIAVFDLEVNRIAFCTNDLCGSIERRAVIDLNATFCNQFRVTEGASLDGKVSGDDCYVVVAVMRVSGSQYI